MTLTITDLDQYRKDGKAPGPDHPANMRTLYSPYDPGVHDALKAVLDSATRSLVIAVYGFDDDEFAGIIAAKLDDPSIYCQITLDRSQAGGVHEKALLAKYKHEFTGNSVAIGNSEKGAIQHRKMALVDGNWYVGGSTNWSDSGETKQDNELVIVQSAALCAEVRPILDIAHDAALQQQARRAKEATP